MKRIYLVTGAAGHLGNALVRQLAAQGEEVRALVLPGDKTAGELPSRAQQYEGDVRDMDSLEPFFTLPQDACGVVIHAAGIVTIASHYDPVVDRVNVGGTANIIAQCRKHGMSKLVYVSSVHAIPELPRGQTMREVADFSPEKVNGLYAKTKAEATALVLQAGKEGLNVSVVHPSGISGPYDNGRGHLTQLLVDYCSGGLKAIVRGGYDFVDVRDVAQGILACCHKGGAGQCYILSNRYYGIPELVGLFAKVTGRPRVKTVLPLWLAKATAPLSEWYYRMKKQTPLYTAYSLETLSGNARFSHAKADAELGYTNRPMEETIADAYDWLAQHGRIRPNRPSRGRRSAMAVKGTV
ncbi:MAG: NAD-dependent epimerase/dehydratase family protein [Eubacteriales bacterium]|nr:NAD-dependent epimerase/dehydratase family protein [Eubacteriales bacterium]